MDQHNRQYIASQIHLKNQSGIPYIVYANDIKQIKTDVDHFPYTRFYRGQFNDSNPHIWEREAGYHPLENDRYIHTNKYIVYPHQSPTQIPCSTILPRKLPCTSKLCNTDTPVNISP